MSERTLALVESPAQLLNVIEWAHVSGERAELRVAVLSPKDSPTRGQLERVAELARGDGLDIDMVNIRALGSGGMLGGVRLTRSLAAASRVVIGDPFSGLIQTLLPFVRAMHIVIVDDGTATWQYARCVDREQPMVRWRLDETAAGSRAVRATRLLSPGAHRAVTVFTSLNGGTPVGAERVVNRYDWTKSWRVPQVRRDEADVLGVSLVETGMVDRTAYLKALRSLTDVFGRVRYLAHRRESANRLAELATVPGVRVERSNLPAELALRQGPVASRVITFPSTVAHTLPVVLDDLDVRVEVRRIEQEWFTPGTSDRARDFVARISADAPVGPVLEVR